MGCCTSARALLAPPTGSNTHGQLGVSGLQQASEPQLVQAGDGVGRWAALAFGRAHAAGLTGSGQLFTWGLNGKGQLGRHPDANVHAPSAVDSQLEFR